MDYFKKDGRLLFYGSMNPKVAHHWIDSTMAILTQMGYLELWVHGATKAIKVWANSSGSQLILLFSRVGP